MSIRIHIDATSGIPFYRQVIDQVLAGIATGVLQVGDRLPTVRALAVELAVNPNTVARAYKELEIRGVVDTQQGTGTFVASVETAANGDAARRRLDRLVDTFLARAASEGFSLEDVRRVLEERNKT